MSALNLTVEPEGPVTLVISVAGVLDRTTAAELRDSLAVAVAGGFPWLVLDLAGVTRCDSSGLAAIVDGLRSAQLGGGELAIANSPPVIQSLMARTELNRVFTPHASVAAAVAALHHRRVQPA